MKLYENGAYLLNGKEVVIDGPQAQEAVKSKTGMDIDKQTAKQETIAYGILKEHNTSGNMDKLQIKFDKLTSHDITFFFFVIVSIGVCPTTCRNCRDLYIFTSVYCGLSQIGEPSYHISIFPKLLM